MTNEKQAWRSEERRQADELTFAIQSTTDAHGARLEAEGRVPILNAVAGALVTVQGGMIASLQDPKVRKALVKQMERALPQAIAQARVRSHCRVMTIGGIKQ